jgi:hypothetical protein
MTRRTAARNDSLESIPGIGPSMARDLMDLGIHEVHDLRKRDPQEMYEVLSDLRGVKMDRCVLYVFRCAVYFAEDSRHDPELLKWWNWTDDRMPKGKRTD